VETTVPPTVFKIQDSITSPKPAVPSSMEGRGVVILIIIIYVTPTQVLPQKYQKGREKEKKGLYCTVLQVKLV